MAGTGSYAAEIVDWARAARIDVVGLIETVDDARVGASVHGVPVVAMRPPGGRAWAILGMGGARRAMWERLASAGWDAITLLHPTASFAADAELGAGATVGPMAVIGAGSVIGEQVMISRGVLLGHHVFVGAFSALNPGVNIGGNATIGQDVFIGMGATVVNDVRVGDGAVIAAGAVVLEGVDPGVRVQGVPARQLSAHSR